MIRTKKITVDTISDLNSVNAAPSDIIEVLGYNTIGDGGGGSFIYEPSDVQVPNSGTILASPNGGNFLRTFYERLNVKYFGATGDGVTDDWNAINAARHVARDIAIVEGTASVFFPIGNYRVTKTIDAEGGSGTMYFGSDLRASNIIFDPPTGGISFDPSGIKPCFLFDNRPTKYTNAQIRNLGITMPASNTEDFVSAISIFLASRLIVDNVWIDISDDGVNQDRIGIFINGQEQIHISNCRIRANVPIRLGGNVDSSSFRDLHLNSDPTNTITRTCIMVDEDTGMQNCEFNSIVGTRADHFLKWDIVTASPSVSKGLLINNGRFEQNTDSNAYAIDINGATEKIERVIINMMQFGGTSNCIRNKSARRVHMLGAQFNQPSVVAINNISGRFWSKASRFNTGQTIILNSGTTIDQYTVVPQHDDTSMFRYTITSGVTEPVLLSYHEKYQFSNPAPINVGTITVLGTIPLHHSLDLQLDSNTILVSNSGNLNLFNDTSVTDGQIVLEWDGSNWNEQRFQSNIPFDNSEINVEISGGEITLPDPQYRDGRETYFIRVKQEGLVADRLDRVIGGKHGDILIMRSKDPARDITLVHQASGVSSPILNCQSGTIDGGQFQPGNYLLSHPADMAMFIRGVNDWAMISASNNTV